MPKTVLFYFHTWGDFRGFHGKFFIKQSILLVHTVYMSSIYRNVFTHPVNSC